MGREEDSNSTVNGSEVAAHSISLARLKCRVPSRSFGRDGLQEWLVAHQQLPKGPHHVGHPLGLSSNTLCSTDQPCELLTQWRRSQQKEIPVAPEIHAAAVHQEGPRDATRASCKRKADMSQSWFGRGESESPCSRIYGQN